jgi:hypothetical protein
MKLYTVVIHCLQMCMKEYGSCQKFVSVTIPEWNKILIDLFTSGYLQYKNYSKNIHLGVATRSSTKWDCLKPIRFHQYTWGLQHFLTFVQGDIGHIKCYWFKINYLFSSSFYIWNRIGFKQSHFVEDLVATPRCMFLVSLFWRWDVVSLT